jgi:serine/threonine protein kinase
MENGALTGTMVDGRYRVGQIVGSGGFGVVYSATHLMLDGKVALKVPRVAEVSGPELSELTAKFFEEGRLLKRLRHPGVVAALDLGLLPPDDAGRALPYLVLEWCEGVTLRDWLSRLAKPLSQAQAWALMRPVLEAVAHAHENDVAHRDLKPGNIIMEEQRGALVPRVIDFGIAKLMPPRSPLPSGSTMTSSDSRVYTPRYAAPEQLVGLRSGPASDVYSLALVLAEVLLGRPVFPTDDSARVAVAEGSLPTPKKLGLSLGPWDDALERAMSMRAPERFPNARAFLEALDCLPPSSIREPLLVEMRRSWMPPLASSTVRAPTGPRTPSRNAPTPSRTVGTGTGGANMAYLAEEVGAQTVLLALHTARAPSDDEWRGWVAMIETIANDNRFDLARTSNLVITDGGAPNTAQRTLVNTLIAQGKTLPAVAVVTSSMIVRSMIRGFSIFNPNIAVFAPVQIAKAAEFLGLTKADVPPLIASCEKLEREMIRPGAIETLRVLTRLPR